VGSAEVELVAVATQLTSLIDRLPPALNRGLDAALAELAGRSAMAVHIGYDVAVPLPAEAATAVYFLCAEALANTAKHSGVASAQIDVEIADGALRVHVRDDGVGGAALPGGTGLIGLADRIAALGGRLVLESPAGGPTTVTATMPLSADPQPGV
jgi:signal transduction histidine kinase